jgi:hypothetical protein
LLVQLERARDQFHRVGARAVAVGMCVPREAAQLCGARAPSVTCLCDRTKAAYAAYGLTEGSLAQVAIGPEVVAAYARAMFRGNAPAPSSDRDAWRMMPGTFAVGADGIIRAVHYARHAADQPDLRAMLQTLRGN